MGLTRYQSPENCAFDVRRRKKHSGKDEATRRGEVSLPNAVALPPADHQPCKAEPEEELGLEDALGPPAEEPGEIQEGQPGTSARIVFRQVKIKHGRQRKRADVNPAASARAYMP